MRAGIDSGPLFFLASHARPNGPIGLRVLKVGANKSALLWVDRAKQRSDWMMADDFVNLRIEPRKLQTATKALLHPDYPPPNPSEAEEEPRGCADHGTGIEEGRAVGEGDAMLAGG